MPENLSVIILTYNEELNLPKCLNSLKGLDADYFVVDSFSSDNTIKIAETFGAKVYANTFETHVKQWQFALQSIPLQTKWVLGIDADQELMPELVYEINTLLAKNDSELADGYYIKRRNYFLGKWIKFGGYYPRYLLKLFRADKVYMDEGELMDHHFYINGRTTKLQYDIIENNLKEDLRFWSDKHIRYAKLQAYEEFNKTAVSKGKLLGNSDQRRLFMKNIWNRMPLFIRPCLYFVYRYIILLGILDGKKGLIFHYLQAFWYRFLIDSFIVEMKNKNAK